MNFRKFDELSTSVGGIGSQQSYSSVNAYDILAEISHVIDIVIQRNLSGDMIIDAIERMTAERKIEIKGIGTNRICIKLLADTRDLLNRMSFTDNTMPVVVKIPYNLSTGGKDNLREEFAYFYTKNLHVKNPDLISADRLSKLLPVTKKYDDYGFILIQEEIIPIENSEIVLAEIKNGNFSDASKASAVISAVVSNEALHLQMYDLVNYLDELFVIADLNVLFSRFNFGFKQIGNHHYLTVLDLGYALPKMFPRFEPKCPRCGQKLRYVNIADDYYNGGGLARKEKIKNKLISQGGFYSCKNENCSNSDINGNIVSSGGTDPFMKKDMDVFEQYAADVRTGYLYAERAEEVSDDLMRIF